MAEVTLEHVTKTFRTKRGRVDAVVDLDLAVRDEEFVVLVGPSGCGKTTILRLIAGLEELTSGTIRIGARVVNRVAPKDRDIAMVFQNYALYPHMTVFNNMAFGLKMRRVPKDEIRRKVEQVAQLLGIPALLDAKPASLSGGEQQRVALGRAIVRRPKVFLFDEPLSNLDAKLRVQTRTEIKSLHRDLHTTIVYVTHDQEEAMTLGDRIVVLYRGMLQQCGAPLDVYNEPANRFVAGFLGNPSMNFLEGRLEGAGDTATLVTGAARLALPKAFSRTLEPYLDRAIVLGIRPEHVILEAGGIRWGLGFGVSGLPPEGAGSTSSTPNAKPQSPNPSLRTGGGSSRSTGDEVSLGRMSIHLVEPLGDATTVHLIGPGGMAVTARLGPAVALATYQQVKVIVDASRIHVFASGDGGERLS